VATTSDSRPAAAAVVSAVVAAASDSTAPGDAVVVALGRKGTISVHVRATAGGTVVNSFTISIP